MKIHVEGAGFMRRHVASGPVDLPDDAVVATLVGALRLPSGHRVVVLIDGKKRLPDDRLFDGESALVVSLLSGG